MAAAEVAAFDTRIGQHSSHERGGQTQAEVHHR